MKQQVKKALYASGGQNLISHLVNRRRLTVAMFHRVVPRSDPAWPLCNPHYTVSTDEFDRVLGLLGAYFTFVSPQAVLAARRGGAALPGRPLLVTFDDGWRDNVDHALPILLRHKVQALFFIATGHIGADLGFWQEELFAAVKEGRIGAGQPDRSIADWTREFGQLPAAERLQRLAMAGRSDALGRQMMTAGELGQLVAAGMSIGAHGHDHEPLTDPDQATDQLTRAMALLNAIDPNGGCQTLSFPHGRYTGEVLTIAQRLGYGMLFTSDKGANPIDQLPLASSFGRTEIDLCRFRIGADRLDEAELMLSLVAR